MRAVPRGHGRKGRHTRGSMKWIILQLKVRGPRVHTARGE